MGGKAQADSRTPGERAVIPVSGRDGEPAKASIVAAISDSDPADKWIPCTPNDDTVLDPEPTALYVGVGGNLSLTDVEGGVALFKNIPNGSILPLRPSRVRATGTTATDIVLIYRSDP